MAPGPDQPLGTDTCSQDLETTAVLLERYRNGEEAAFGRLVSRYIPLLKKLARRWLPAGYRDLEDTDDLVQITLLRALGQVREFEPRREGAFLAYLRMILKRHGLDQVKHKGARPPHEPLPEQIRGESSSPLEIAIGKERMAMYERALAGLTDRKREAVILRFELGYSFPEIAAALGISSSNAARMLVSRALVRVTELMDEH